MSLTYTDCAAAHIQALRDGQIILIVSQGDIEISARLSPDAYDELKESME